MIEIKNRDTIQNTLLFRKGMCLAFSFLFCFIGFSQVKAVLDTTSIKIGEEIKYSIEVEADTSAVVTFPEGQTFLPLEVIEFYDIDTTYEQARYRLIKKYGLTQFDSGKYVLPPQMVRINESLFYTDSLLVEVADVVVDTTKQKMFDIKTPIDVPAVRGKWMLYLFWILIGLAILGGIIYLLIRRKKKLEEAKRQLPPYEEALVALQTLDNSEYLKNNQIKDYYSSLTEIVKRYLDREVDEAALESTTDELIDRLHLHKDSGHLDFDAETIAKLNKILKRADLIKFAKMKMESGQAQLDRKDIESIINETHEAIPEPTEEELMQDAIYQEKLLKKRQRRKIALGIGSFIAVLVIGFVVLSSIYGLQNVKDAVFGNYTKSLAEGTWVKSEYGYPAVILESPEVLIRKELPKDETNANVIGDVEHFEFGAYDEALYINVTTFKIMEEAVEMEDEDLDFILEGTLVGLEDAGAVNIIINKEWFSTEKGVRGIKSSGEFNLKLPNGKISQEKVDYEVLLFGQNGGVQMLTIINRKDDKYAQQIKERILNSVELEVINKQR